MREDPHSTLIAALLGLSVGGVIGDFVADFASIAIPVATAGAIAAAGYASLRHADVTRAGALGGGIGLIIGTCIAILDRIIGS